MQPFLDWWQENIQNPVGGALTQNGGRLAQEMSNGIHPSVGHAADERRRKAEMQSSADRQAEMQSSARYQGNAPPPLAPIEQGGVPMPQQPAPPAADLRSEDPAAILRQIATTPKSTGMRWDDPRVKQAQAGDFMTVDPRTEFPVPQGKGNIPIQMPRGPITMQPGPQQGMPLQPRPQYDTAIEQMADLRFGKQAPVIQGSGPLGQGLQYEDMNWQRDRDKFREQLTMTPQDQAREHYLLTQSFGPQAANLAMEAAQAQRSMLLQMLGGDRRNELGYAEAGTGRLQTTLNANNEAERNQLVRERNQWDRSAQAILAPALVEQMNKGTFNPAAFGEIIKSAEKMGYSQGQGPIRLQGQPGQVPVPGGPGQEEEGRPRSLVTVTPHRTRWRGRLTPRIPPRAARCSTRSRGRRTHKGTGRRWKARNWPRSCGGRWGPTGFERTRR